MGSWWNHYFQSTTPTPHVVHTRWLTICQWVEEPVDDAALDAMVVDVAKRLQSPLIGPQRFRVWVLPPAKLRDLAVKAGADMGFEGGAHAESWYAPGAGLLAVPSLSRHDLLAHELAHAIDDCWIHMERDQWEPRARAVESEWAF